MPAINIRNVTDETHRALKHRAKRNGRSMEAEICDILERTVRPETQKPLGTMLANIGKKAGLTDEEWKIFDKALKRDEKPSEPVKF